MAAEPIEKFAVIVVVFTTVKLLTVTPVPPMVTAVAPVRLLPVNVTATTLGEPTVPGAPALGAIEVTVGVLPTVKVTVLLVPPGVVTVTFLAVSAAPLEIVKVAVIVVEFTTVTPLTVTPPPATATAVLARPLVKLVPVSVTATVLLRAPTLGAIEVSVGAAAFTVKVVLLLVPTGVVTVTFLVFCAAALDIARVAAILVEFSTVKLLTVTPVPDTVTAVAPFRLVPVRITGTLLFLTPVLGALEVKVGAALVTV